MVWKITTEELLERYAAGERNFAGIEISGETSEEWGGIDLEGAVLRDINLRGACFHEVCLIGADLTGAELSGIFLDSCVLYNATLRKANLNWACVRGSSFSNADMRMTKLAYVDASHAIFPKAIIGGWFESSILIRTNFHGAKFVINGRDYGSSYIWGDMNFIFNITLPDGTILRGPEIS